MDKTLEKDEYEEKLEIVLGKIKGVLISKHHDYGSDNLKRHGLFGILVRLSDKISRLENLVAKNKKEEVKEEKIQDTFLDIAGYAIQALVLFFSSTVE